MRNNSRQRRPERGNILFLILLAVVLFVALANAVTQSLRGGGKNASDEALQAQASEIINYASLLENSITRLMLVNGCTDTMISFHFDSDGDGTLENNSQDAYYNTNAPTDFRCHVYQPNGGNINRYQINPKFTIDSLIHTITGSTAHNYGGNNSGGVAIHSRGCIAEVGTTFGTASCGGPGNDLLFSIPHLTSDICRVINRLAGLGSIIPGVNTQLENSTYNGTYTSSINTMLPFNGSPSVLIGQRTFCASDNSGYAAGNVFFHVLIAR